MYSLWFACEHYVLHAFVSIIVYLFLYAVGIHFIFYLWILGTFIVDLDHLVDWFNPKDKTEKLIVGIMEDGNKSFGRRIKIAVKDYWRKGFVHLLFHNLVFFLAVMICLLLFHSSVPVTSFLGAILVHQLVDITGDIKRWGNINNWLWKKE